MPWSTFHAPNPQGIFNSQPLLGKKSHRSLARGGWEQPGPCRQSRRSAELAREEELPSAPHSGRYRASSGAGSAPQAHSSYPIGFHHPQEHRARVQVNKRSQPAGGLKWQWCARTPACPAGHAGGGPDRRSPYLAFSTLGARDESSSQNYNSQTNNSENQSES